MTRVLVTGADGFIGSHLTEALVRAGHDVRAFVLYNSFNSWGWLDHCEPDVKGHFDVFAGDIRDPHGMRTAIWASMGSHNFLPLCVKYACGVPEHLHFQTE